MRIMDHNVSTESTRDSLYLAHCSCGWRGDKWQTRKELADEEATNHDMDARYLRLNSGSRPSLKTLAKEYRKKSESNVYTRIERDRWEALAVEIEQELEARKNVIEGQTELF